MEAVGKYLWLWFIVAVVLIATVGIFVGASNPQSASAKPPQASPEETVQILARNAAESVRAAVHNPYADFRNVMAMHPKGFPKEGVVFCGEVEGARGDYVRFLTAGDEVTFVPYGSVYERTFQKFCMDAEPLTAVTF